MMKHGFVRAATAVLAMTGAGSAQQQAQPELRDRAGARQRLHARWRRRQHHAVGGQGRRADGRCRPRAECRPRARRDPATAAARGRSPRRARAAGAEVRRRDTLDGAAPIAIRTHRSNRSATSSTPTCHPDHVGGNQKLRKAGKTFTGGNVAGNIADAGEGAAILAHENVLQRMTTPPAEPAGDAVRRAADRHLLTPTA